MQTPIAKAPPSPRQSGKLPDDPGKTVTGGGSDPRRRNGRGETQRTRNRREAIPRFLGCPFVRRLSAVLPVLGVLPVRDRALRSFSPRTKAFPGHRGQGRLHPQGQSRSTNDFHTMAFRLTGSRRLSALRPRKLRPLAGLPAGRWHDQPACAFLSCPRPPGLPLADAACLPHHLLRDNPLARALIIEPPAHSLRPWPGFRRQAPQATLF